MGSLILEAHPFANGSSAAHFGSGIAFLIPPDLDIENRNEQGGFPVGLFPVQLSPYGNFVAGLQTVLRRSSDEPSRKISQIHLWVTDQIDPSGSFTYPPPTFSVSLDFLDPQYGDTAIQEALAFSSDEQYLALQTQSEVVLFSMPELLPYKSISAVNNPTSFGRLSWSSDSSLVAALLSDAILVWEFSADHVYRYELTHPFDELTRFGDEWLLWTEHGTDVNPTDFMICTRLLERCEAYTTPDVTPRRVFAVDPNNQVVLTLRRYSDDVLVIGAWTHQEEGTCVLDDIPFNGIENRFLPTGFSPTGQYIAGRRISNSQITIWNFETLALINETMGYENPIWLGSDEFFITNGLDLKLYQLNVNDPLDRLNLFNIRIAEDIEPFAEPNRTQAASFDGRWILHNESLYSLLIPIVYE
jgi:WD40 repeat protein